MSPSELPTRDQDELSGDESDYADLQSTLTQFKATLGEFNAFNDGGFSEEESQTGNEATRSRGVAKSRGRGRGRGRGGNRGPRKAAEPTGDIKYRLGKASEAFIQEDYIVAREMVKEVIRINAETHEAWTLLASIFKELGDVEKAVTSLLCAAHLRPKDIGGWLNCARFAMEDTSDLRSKHLNTAKICYSSALRVNSKDLEARCGKATVLREMGFTSTAISQYRQALLQKPHDTLILRQLAEAYIDEDQAEAAIELYQQSIAFYRNLGNAGVETFGWSDLNIYVELYAYLGQYKSALWELRSLARWILGREQESWWDEVQDDDREWDEDDSRRIKEQRYTPGLAEAQRYGAGLPLELRVKLGVYRLRLQNLDEAMLHFSWLDVDNASHRDLFLDYPDLFREVADALYDCDCPKEALPFYQALAAASGQFDASIHVQIGKCYLALNLVGQAEDLFHAAIRLDEENIDARLALAKLFESLNEQEQAFIQLNEIIKLRRRIEQRHSESSRLAALGSHGSTRSASGARNSLRNPRRLADATERQKQENLIVARLQDQYTVMRLQHHAMRAGVADAVNAWMEAAQELVEDFRSFKRFYPWDKYVRFLGYTKVSGDQSRTGATSLDVDLAAMADRLSNKLGTAKDVKDDIPENYRGISFASWLDIFLEYALCLARCGRRRESYEICEAAKDAIVFYHSREDMFLIHICWCTCALIANDEQTCVFTCRYFAREYQFTTDSYRMFAAMTRLCHSPVSWYTSGPTQKYILRQIKAMDFGLVDDDARLRHFGEKGSYSVTNVTGQPIINDEMDVALLMLYGHILYAGTSYQYALNYFFRARALDPENPMINLSMALGYIHYGLKRQSENRQFHMLQGLSFLFMYYDRRKGSVHVEERQEAHYNVARTYHMLGLSHLALPYYARVLEEVEHGRPTPREDLVRDAAYNLQALYATVGNLQLARSIGEQWLEI